ncbi:hypothetical protein ACFQI7_34880 [Paenibacillus allorhizosphaerae]|uniref:6-aminohexanoate hydrolase n=1 Tax=Paenibacillus allorhizosphaerae TaxID=2849866 RepID=A0ABN7TYW1_9BACL|nr:hypothetical protein [Paenibacillus allorhizosphaerae]CAG7657616.1 hypothetical protein PAECIP111802_06788 [Paenibacillus allorhizosphaerae]
MGIELAIVLLTYVLLVVMAYLVFVFTSDKEKRGIIIINRAYNYAYSALSFGVLVIFALIKMPNVTLDKQTTNYLILACKFISVITLGGTAFILNKYYKR